MGGVVRSLCVSVPFILTGISIITLLIVGLAGVTGSNLSLFEVVTKDLSVNMNDAKNIDFNGKSLGDSLSDAGIDTSKITGRYIPTEEEVNNALDAVGGVNITAEKLGLGDKYNFFLWNFVEVKGGQTIKQKTQFNYASNFSDTSSIDNLAAGTGVDVKVPDAIKDGLKLFANCIKWSEILFLIAIVMQAVTLLIGVTACCSRAGSCVTWVVSTVALAAMTAFAVLTTVTSTIIVGTLNTAAKDYGLQSSVSTTWLAITWVGVATSIASGLYWMFTTCCCKGSSGSKNRDSVGDTEKLMGGSNRGYQPVHDPYQPQGQQQTGIYNQQQYYPMGNVKHQDRAQAYEPYSHHTT